MSEPNLDPEVASLEAALAAMAPAPAAIDREEIMFRAGQMSSQGRARSWRRLSAGLGLAASVLGVLLAVRPAPEPQFIACYGAPPLAAGATTKSAGAVVDERSKPREAPLVPMPTEARPQRDLAYLRLRAEVLRNGADALPTPTAMADASPARSGPTSQPRFTTLGQGAWQ